MQGDPVKDLVKRFIGELEAVKRKTMTTEDVTQDDAGLETLVVDVVHRCTYI